MKITYDSEVEVLRIVFSYAPSHIFKDSDTLEGGGEINLKHAP